MIKLNTIQEKVKLQPKLFLTVIFFTLSTLLVLVNAATAQDAEGRKMVVVTDPSEISQIDVEELEVIIIDRPVSIEEHEQLMSDTDLAPRIPFLTLQMDAVPTESSTANIFREAGKDALIGPLIHLGNFSELKGEEMQGKKARTFALGSLFGLIRTIYGSGGDAKISFISRVYGLSAEETKELVELSLYSLEQHDDLIKAETIPFCNEYEIQKLKISDTAALSVFSSYFNHMETVSTEFLYTVLMDIQSRFTSQAYEKILDLIDNREMHSLNIDAYSQILLNQENPNNYFENVCNRI